MYQVPEEKIGHCTSQKLHVSARITFMSPPRMSKYAVPGEGEILSLIFVRGVRTSVA